MPFGLISSTLPFDCRAPRITEGSPPVMRLSTALVVEGWMKRVVSLLPIEKPCQLIMALAELVMDMTLPLVLMAAVPLTTWGAVGMARTAVGRKDISMNAAAIRLWFRVSLNGAVTIDSWWPPYTILLSPINRISKLANTTTAL